MAGSATLDTTKPTTLPEYFTFSSSNPKKTGLRLISLHDSRTNFTVRTAISQEGKQVPAIMAFAGARFSRSALTAEELFEEINVNAASAQKKLANIFVNYGHASVGDMANLFAYLENMPRYLMFQFFYSSALGAGQERSSRFQDFSKATPPELSLYMRGKKKAVPKRLEKQYYALFHSLIERYTTYLPPVIEAYTNFYQPEPGNKMQASALQARSFDTVRYFLPAGTNTSGAYITSAREWTRLIVQFKSSPYKEAQYLGEQLEMLFSPSLEIAKSFRYLPEAPDLIRHTEPDLRVAATENELSVLAKDLIRRANKVRETPHKQRLSVKAVTGLSATQTYLFYSLLRLAPQLTVAQFKKWYAGLSQGKIAKISAVLLNDYDHHHHLPLYAHTGAHTFELQLTLSEIIDLNRHRAWGRFTPFLETAEVGSLLESGFQLPLYLEHKQFRRLRQSFTDDFSRHYEALQQLAADLPAEVSPRLLLSLLPNAHSARFFLSAGPKEIHYMTHLRARPGGHINYREAAWQIAQKASKIEPLLQAITLGDNKRPAPFDREEFFDRS